MIRKMRVLIALDGRIMPTRSSFGTLCLSCDSTGRPTSNPTICNTYRFDGSAGRTRTYNPSVNSRMLCH